MRLVRNFARTLGYFTILPAGRTAAGPPEPGDVVLLPLAGIVTGAAAGSIAYAASFAVPPRVAAAVAYAAPIVLTGALHLDGFLDTCDAALASVPLERRREILRDPRHGSYAFAGGAVLTILSYSALREIEPRNWPAALAIACGTARFAALVAAQRSEATGSGTASRAFAERPAASALFAQGALLALAAFAGGGRKRAIAAALCVAASVPAAEVLARRFGGRLGGDGYGFLISAGECAMLLASASTPE